MHNQYRGGQHQRWPTKGQGGYITPATSGVPTASEPGAASEVAHKCITNTASGVPTASERGAASEVAHKWARWLHNPCRRGDPHRFRAGGSIRGGPQRHNQYRLGGPHRFRAGGSVKVGPQVSKVAT